jgi:hypothetical protein
VVSMSTGRRWRENPVDSKSMRERVTGSYQMDEL